MKMALLVIGGLCEAIGIIGLLIIYFHNQDPIIRLKGLELCPNWKAFLWFAVGTICLIFGLCL